MDNIEKRIVEMEFRYEQFEEGISKAIDALSKLEDKLKLDDADNGMSHIANSTKAVVSSLGEVEESAGKVELAFSGMQVVAMTALSQLTIMALRYGKKIADNLWGPIMSGGATRALNIESAKFQLEGLGVAWNDIADDINYGVKDTAYGLDAAAKVASQLIASGVQIGDQMRNTLRGISGVAAMTNSSYEEIGSIFTTVASNGKLMTMQLRQLSARGLNVAAILAQEMGKSEAEINAMVTKGQIDFQTFADAMDNAFGEHAKEANKTFSGAMSNVRAALARIGAEFASPKFEFLRKVFNDTIPVINAVKNAMMPIVDIWSNILFFASASIGRLLKSRDFMLSLINIVVNFYSYLRPIYNALYEIGWLSNDLRGAATGLNNFLSQFQLYGDNAVKVKDAFVAFFSVIEVGFTFLKGIFNALSPLLDGFVYAFGRLFGISGNLSYILINSKKPLEDLIMYISEFIRLKLDTALHAIKAVLDTITVNPLIFGVRALSTILAAVVYGLYSFGSFIYTMFVNVRHAVIGLMHDFNIFVNLIAASLAGLGGLFETIFGGGLSSVIGQAIDGITRRVPGLTKAFGTIANKAPQIDAAISSTADRIARHSPEIGHALDDTQRAIDGVGDSISAAADKIHDKAPEISEAFDDVVEKVPDLEEAFHGIDDVASDTEDKTDRIMKSYDRTAKSASRAGKNISKSYNATKAGLQDVRQRAEETTQAIENANEAATGAKGGTTKPTRETISVDTPTPEVETEAPDTHQRMGFTAEDVEESLEEQTETEIGGIQLFVEKLLDLFNVSNTLVGQGLVTFAKGLDIVLNDTMDIMQLVYEKIVNCIKTMTPVKAIFIALGALVVAAVVLVVDLIKLVIDSFAIIPKLFDTFDNISKAFAAKAQAAKFTGIALMIGAIAALVGTIGLIAKFVDPEKLETTLDILMKTIKDIGAISIQLMALMLAIESILTIQPIVNKTTGKLVKNPFQNVASILLAFALDIIVFVGAVYALGNIKTGVLIKGTFWLITLAGLIAAFLAAMAAISKSLEIKTTTTTDISLKSKTAKTEVTSSLQDMTLMMLALTPAIWSLSIAVKRLGKLDTKVLIKGSAVLSGIMFALTGFMLVMNLSAKSFLVDVGTQKKSNFGLIIDQVQNPEKGAIGEMVKMLRAISGVVLMLTGAIIMMSWMSPKQLLTGFTALITIMGLLQGFMLSMALVTGLLEMACKSYTSDGKGISSAMKSLGDMFKTIMPTVITLAGIVALFSIIPIEYLWSSIGALFAMLVEIFFFADKMGDIAKDFDSSKVKPMVSALNSLIPIFIIMTGVMAFIAGMMQSGQIDWVNLGISLIAVAGVLGILAGFMWLIQALIKPEKVDVITKAMNSMVPFAGAVALMAVSIGAAIWLMSSVGSGVERVWPIIAAFGVFIALMFGLATLTSKFAPIGVTAIVAMGVIAGLILAMGYTAKMLGEAVSEIMAIKWGSMTGMMSAIYEIFAGLAGLPVPNIGVFTSLPMVAGSLYLLGKALEYFSAIPDVTSVAESIAKFLSSLAEAFANSGVFSESMTQITFILPLFAGALMLSSAMLLVAGAGLYGFAYVMLMSIDLLKQVLPQLVSLFTQMTTTIDSVGIVIRDSMEGLVMGAASMVVFGTLLALGGAFILAGSIVLLAGSAILLGASKVLEIAINKVTEMISIMPKDVVDTFALTVAYLGATMLLASIPLAAGSLTFIVAAALFLAGMAIFVAGTSKMEEASDNIHDAVDNIIDTFQDLVDAVFGTIDLLNEGLGGFYDIGTNIVEGLTSGITDSIDTVIDTMAGLVDTIITGVTTPLEIHSPSQFFRDIGWNTVAGFVEGIEDKFSDVSNTMGDLATTAGNAFNLDLSGDGSSAIETLASAFFNKLSEYLPGMSSAASGAGAATGGAFGGSFYNATASGVNKTIAQLLVSLTQLDTAIQHSEGVIKERLLEQQEALRNSLNAAKMDYVDPTQFLPSTSFGTGSTGISSDTAGAISAASGGGSGINDLSRGGGTNINSNNTYNYVQNNYSPEALSRTDIYLQTRNQLREMEIFARSTT